MWNSSVFFSWNFSLLSLTLFRWDWFNKVSNFLSWLAVASSKLSSPQIKMSSTIAFTPSNPPILLDSLHYSLKFFRSYTNAKGIHPPKRLSARGFLHLMVQDRNGSLISATENTLVSIANFCKQMISSWVWILVSLGCDVQWSTAYAESYSILSRRFAVYN